jgi:hypothetical protein
MARVHPIFANWTSGELSPLLWGRVDFDKFVSGARRIENFIIHPHGPVSRRSGTRFVAEVKDSTRDTFVIPFEFSTEQAYIIEFGRQYMRFYKDGGRIESPPGTPVEATHSYTEDQIPSIKYIQSADTMYFFHPTVAPQKLVRTSHTAWTVKEVRFLPPATYEAGFMPATTLTLAATTGLGVVFTAGAAVFLPGDVGRMIEIGDGRAIITAQAGNTATVDIVDAFASVGPHASQAWTIKGSPAHQLTPTVAKPRHARTTLNAAAANGAFRAADVGKYIRINKGVVRILSVASADSVTAEILAPLMDSTASPSGSWTLEESAWSSTRGYPRAGAFHEQRMVTAGSNSQPQSFWGSSSGDIENFGLGPDNDDAFEFKIAANDVNTILWIVPTRVLLLGTASCEFQAVGGNDEAITPTNVDVKVETSWGSSPFVRPLRVAHAGIFADRSRRDVRELLFSTERDSYVSNNLLLLAEHLTRDFGVSELAYQRNPHSTIWAIRDDGVLLSCTYQREHNVVAWARHFTGPDQPQDGSSPVKGQFESVAVIPHWAGDRDVTWFVVKRTINGATKRYIEHFDDTGGYYGRLYVDCGLTYDGAPATVISGLSHLNGETVQIVGDGAVYPEQVVAGGQVTLQGDAASFVEVGLQYISTLETMDPEVPLQGTSQGRMKHWSEIAVRLNESLGCFIDDEELPFRSSQDVMDAPPPIFTGDYPLRPRLARATNAPIKVQQKQPLPITVVAVFGTLGIGD